MADMSREGLSVPEIKHLLYLIETTPLQAAQKREGVLREAMIRLQNIHEWQHLSNPNVVADEVADIAQAALRTANEEVE